MSDLDLPPPPRAADARPDRLAQPLRAGAWSLHHRLVLAPATTGLAQAGLPGPSMAAFYADRTTQGGLVVTEPAWVGAAGAQGLPGLHDGEQANAWRLVTRAIQSAGGIAIAQLRDASPPPRDDAGIDGALDRYRRAAEHAFDAGFDGVELDGGALATSALFLLESVGTLAAVWEAGRVGVRLAAPVGATALARLDQAAIAYVHLVAAGDLASFTRPAFPGVLLVSSDVDATRLLELGADLVGVDRAPTDDAAWIARRLRSCAAD